MRTIICLLVGIFVALSTLVAAQAADDAEVMAFLDKNADYVAIHRPQSKEAGIKQIQEAFKWLFNQELKRSRMSSQAVLDFYNTADFYLSENLEAAGVSSRVDGSLLRVKAVTVRESADRAVDKILYSREARPFELLSWAPADTLIFATVDVNPVALLESIENVSKEWKSEEYPQGWNMIMSQAERLLGMPLDEFAPKFCNRITFMGGVRDVKANRMKEKIWYAFALEFNNAEERHALLTTFKKIIGIPENHNLVSMGNNIKFVPGSGDEFAFLEEGPYFLWASSVETAQKIDMARLEPVSSLAQSEGFKEMASELPLKGHGCFYLSKTANQILDSELFDDVEEEVKEEALPYPLEDFILTSMLDSFSGIAAVWERKGKQLQYSANQTIPPLRADRSPLIASAAAGADPDVVSIFGTVMCTIGGVETIEHMGRHGNRGRQGMHGAASKRNPDMPFEEWITNEMGEKRALENLARSDADLRTLATATETFYVDHNRYPSHGLLDQGINNHLDVLHPAYALPTFIKKESDGRGNAKVHTEINTPIRYITDIPFDQSWGEERVYPLYYSPDGKSWIMICAGPDKDYDIDPEKDYKPDDPAAMAELEKKRYNPANGLDSSGDIFRTSQRRFNTPPVHGGHGQPVPVPHQMNPNNTHDPF